MYSAPVSADDSNDSNPFSVPLLVCLRGRKRYLSPLWQMSIVGASARRCHGLVGWFSASCLASARLTYSMRRPRAIEASIAQGSEVTNPSLIMAPTISMESTVFSPIEASAYWPAYKIQCVFWLDFTPSVYFRAPSCRFPKNIRKNHDVESA